MPTGVGTFRGAKAKPESVMYYNTKYSEDVPDQMRRAYSVKGGTQDGQWRSSLTSSTCLGTMSASHSRSTSSRRARRKVLQQPIEELRAEYMEGKGAAAVRRGWAAAEPTTATTADTETDAVSSIKTRPNSCHIANSTQLTAFRAAKEEFISSV